MNLFFAYDFITSEIDCPPEEMYLDRPIMQKIGFFIHSDWCLTQNQLKFIRFWFLGSKEPKENIKLRLDEVILFFIIF